MRRIHTFLVSTVILATPVVFAADQDAMSSSDSKPCATIAAACLDAGFVRTETPGKQFWQDCMKPVILGQTVAGVTVDAATIKECRANKIEELKKALKELKQAAAK